MDIKLENRNGSKVFALVNVATGACTLIEKPSHESGVSPRVFNGLDLQIRIPTQFCDYVYESDAADLAEAVAPVLAKYRGENVLEHRNEDAVFRWTERNPREVSSREVSS